ncbi:MAG TPA: Wzz/FepE/Etk N-terminal domain-containing protein [Alistipes sp.]|uniref:Wzz/FepE/Etk N-terminal domain-containing protein n=1 Tax=Alistipes sp. TaxID=1872444 RepID=UPI002C647DAF|nr:Wzz/FepE/Etk N-terminal domain-containing protein [Alistipes sp.]HUN14138.1 Wzz/FepE/Etk N-terminal domain-containing protein [Alistipes sp.]
MKNDMQETPARPDDEQIDLLAVARKLWAERKLIMRWCAMAALAGLVIGFSIPKEYTTETVLAPETSSGKGSLGGLSSLASLAGINMGNMTDADAINPDVYPEIVESLPFVTELFPVVVETRNGKLRTDLYDYLLDHQRAPWWSAVLSAPFKALGWVAERLRGDAETEGPVDPFRLTPDQSRVAENLAKRVVVVIDKKTSLVTLSVTMQDPLISATLADTVMRNLQNYVTDYRTNKARLDLAFTQQLFDEAQQKYYHAQQRYARYMDANQNVVRRSVRTEQERLQNEVTLAYNVYNQMAQQLQLAKAKVQESTPVYAVVQPATVPLRAAKPSKMLILAGFIFLGGGLASGWVFGVRDFVRNFNEKSPQEE